MALEYIIYCDESESKGRRFSNFYGGALVRSTDLEEVNAAVAAKKRDLNLFGEVKWSKISPNYCQKYLDLIDAFFDLVAADKVKIRIMFTQNAARATKLTKEHVAKQYSILYYYFIRHAFGLVYSPVMLEGTRVRVYPDRLPIPADQVRIFKNYILRLNGRSEFMAARVQFSREDLTEVISHEHNILQCLDIVLGAMNFRLNQKHLDNPNGPGRPRPLKTRIREKVYDHINERIRRIYPNFNIGITTGHQGDYSNRWNHSYRHWNFRTTDKWR